ncbi:MAG: serine/threonine protein kinase [Labilithrix sp.]|nr:serine/threonine protein kinase [Labilithrix sp.]
MPEVPFGTVVGGDYMILRPLGRGSMGALYVAEQLSTAHPRALKILRSEYVADETLFKRFEREAQMAAKIRSEHVTQVIASGVDAKLQVPWIAMELLEGQHLGHYVEERGPLPKETVRVVFEQLCHALGAAHKLGIVHRDLKPANVFLGSAHRVGAEMTVKVLDFGVASIIAESLTQLGEPLGTPSWMAPEQTRGEDVTQATDVWALGLIAFYMLTGRVFWRAATRPDDHAGVMREIAQAVPIASMRALELGVADYIPAGFNEWFAQSVAQRASERFVSAAAAYAALANALGARER